MDLWSEVLREYSDMKRRPVAGPADVARLGHVVPCHALSLPCRALSCLVLPVLPARSLVSYHLVFPRVA